MGLMYFLGTVPFRVKQFFRNLFEKPVRAWDPTDWALVISNLSLLFLVISFEMPISAVFIIYFIQTAIICLFFILKILFTRYRPHPLLMKKFTDALIAGVIFAFILCLEWIGLVIVINVDPNIALESQSWKFFEPIDYFHLYQENSSYFLPIITMSLVFFLNHLFSFFYHFIVRKEEVIKTMGTTVMGRKMVIPSRVGDYAIESRKFYGIFYRLKFLAIGPWLTILPLLFFREKLLVLYFPFAVLFILVKTCFDLNEHFRERSQ